MKSSRPSKSHYSEYNSTSSTNITKKIMAIGTGEGNLRSCQSGRPIQLDEEKSNLLSSFRQPVVASMSRRRVDNCRHSNTCHRDHTLN